MLEYTMMRAHILFREVFNTGVDGTNPSGKKRRNSGYMGGFCNIRYQDNDCG